MASLAKLRSHLSDDLEDQVSRLKKEVSVLRKELGSRGGSLYDETREGAADLYDHLAARVSEALPHVRKQSKVVRRAAADNPVTTAVIGLALLGLAVGLLTRRH